MGIFDRFKKQETQKVVKEFSIQENNEAFKTIFGHNKRRLEIKKIDINNLSETEKRIGAIFSIAVNSINNGDFNNALEMFENVSPYIQHHYFYSLKGNALKGLNNIEGAIIAYKTSIEYEDNHIEYSYLADCFRVKGDLSNSLLCYSEAIKIFETQTNNIFSIDYSDNKKIISKYYYNRALCYYDFKEKETFLNAIEDGKKAILLDNTYYRPYYIIAISYLKLHFLTMSEKYLMEGVKSLELGVSHGDNNCIIIYQRLRSGNFSSEMLS